MPNACPVSAFITCHKWQCANHSRKLQPRHIFVTSLFYWRRLWCKWDPCPSAPAECTQHGGTIILCMRISCTGCLFSRVQDYACLSTAADTRWSTSLRCVHTDSLHPTVEITLPFGSAQRSRSTPLQNDEIWTKKFRFVSFIFCPGEVIHNTYAKEISWTEQQGIEHALSCPYLHWTRITSSKRQHHPCEQYRRFCQNLICNICLWRYTVLLTGFRPTSKDI